MKNKTIAFIKFAIDQALLFDENFRVDALKE